jgi:hypothetical protein
MLSRGVPTPCHLLRALPASLNAGPIPPDMASLPNAMFIDLSSNQLNGSILLFASDLDSLGSPLLYFNASHNALTGPLPEAFGGLMMMGQDDDVAAENGDGSDYETGR